MSDNTGADEEKSKRELEREILDESELEKFVEEHASDEESESESEEESEEEKGEETELNLDNLRNINFNRAPSGWTITPSKAPVLEEITEERETPRFVNTGTQSPRMPGQTQEDETSEATYIPTTNQSGTGSDYTVSRNQIEQIENVSLTPQRIDTRTIRFDTSPRVPKQETFFMQSREAGFGNSWSSESINIQTQRVDPSNVGREDPLEKDIKKYEKYDPDRPTDTR